MESTKVLFISQEITPYLPETHMSVVCRNLPQGIQERGREIRTFMPRFGCINERRNQLHEVIRLSGMNLIINDTDHPLIIKVASIQSARMQVYFIDNEDYFSRKATIGDAPGESFPDNDERTIFFTRGVLETVKKLRWSPDVIHCHGWFTALIPLLIKKAYKDDPLFVHSKIVYSAYNDEFKSPLDKTFRNKVLMEGISKKDVSVLENPDYLAINKLAFQYADGIIIADTINPDVKESIESSGKPFLNYNNSENYIDEYALFYEKILAESNE
ncbi:MAG TPA: glycogen/starch synthase [Bacteroidales bacterium]|nr:glycogen/starch synthase [Bacteroidales bacterium]